MPNCTAPATGALPICCAGGVGTFLGGDLEWPVFFEALWYLFVLLWLFAGVGLISDVFMSAIEAVTSQTQDVTRTVDGVARTFRVKVWNDTVANLTLMALGSSAPEILLAVIELVFKNGFKSGDLGPSTIVGSAAFNLMIIIAVCVMAIPEDDGRKIAQLGVYSITATCSVFSYLWLVFVLQYSTPDMVTVGEAFLTLFFFPVLIFFAYTADKWSDEQWKRKHPLFKHCAGGAKIALPSSFVLDIKNPDGTSLKPAELVGIVQQLNRNKFAGVSSDDAAKILSDHLAAQQPKSRAYYRVKATRQLVGGGAHPAALQAGKRSSSIASAISSTLGGGSPTGMRRRLTDKALLLTDISLGGAGVARELQPVAPEPSTVQFASPKYAVMENAALVTVQVQREGPCDFPLKVSYETQDGVVGTHGCVSAAHAGEDFVASSGVLEFEADQRTLELSVTIVDDDVEEDDEQFTIHLLEPLSEGFSTALGDAAVTAVTIINDDFPGTFILPNEDVRVARGAVDAAEVVVERANGASGAVSLRYRTIDRRATAGEDFAVAEGELSWAHGDVTPRSIVVQLLRDAPDRGEPADFDLEIAEATGGAKFDDRTDGSAERSLARVTIVEDEVAKGIAARAAEMLGVMTARRQLGASSWGEQFRAALKVDGDDDEQDDAESGEGAPAPPGATAWANHILTLPFKLIFATVPPAAIFGGWPCFVVSIAYIGIVTAFIGDVASLLGCVISLKEAVVAITLVALGTSLPDTFASKAAALGDATADAAVGNVTGSNSVNVFLGLGIAWFVGAVYWAANGATQEWFDLYPEIAAANPGIRIGDSVGLAVPAGNLAFSVSLFCCCALVVLLTLALRRKFFGYELGSKARKPTAALFGSLWVFYILLSSLKEYDLI